METSSLQRQSGSSPSGSTLLMEYTGFVPAIAAEGSPLEASCFCHSKPHPLVQEFSELPSSFNTFLLCVN